MRYAVRTIDRELLTQAIGSWVRLVNVADVDMHSDKVCVHVHGKLDYTEDEGCWSVTSTDSHGHGTNSVSFLERHIENVFRQPSTIVEITIQTMDLGLYSRSGSVSQNHHPNPPGGRMKPIWSKIGENQTIAINTLTTRIAIRHRKWSNGQRIEETKDVIVDGYVYTPAVSDAWLSGAIGTIMQLVEKKPDELHIGLGQWIYRQKDMEAS